MRNFYENSATFLLMPQNLQNFAKFQKLQLDNLVDFEKCCKTHIYLQISTPIQPKTSEILPKFVPEARGPRARTCSTGPATRSRGRSRSPVERPAKGKISKFLAGSFSAVSKRNFARKYAFDSIFKLYKICILLHRCNLKLSQKLCLKKQQFS